MKKICLLFSITALLACAIGVNAQSVVFNTSETSQRFYQMMSQGDMQGAMAVLDKAIAKKKDLLEALRMRAQFRSQNGDFDGAIADMTAAIEHKPNAEFYEMRGFYRFLDGKNLDEALKDFDSAVALGLNAPRIYSMKGSIKAKAKNFEGAIKDYQAGIALYPDSAQLQVGLAEALSQQGSDEKAAASLRTFLDNYEQRRDGKLPKVRGVTNGETKIIKKEEIDGKEVAQVTGQMSFQVATPEEAMRKAKQLEERMHLANAYGRLGVLYHKQNNLDEALIALDKAAKIDSNERNALGFRGRIYVQTGKYQEGIDEIKTSLKKVPTFTHLYLERGIAYLMLGKDADAQADFDKYLQSHPNNKETLEKRIAEAKEKRAQMPQ